SSGGVLVGVALDEKVPRPDWRVDHEKAVRRPQLWRRLSLLEERQQDSEAMPGRRDTQCARRARRDGSRRCGLGPRWAGLTRRLRGGRRGGQGCRGERRLLRRRDSGWLLETRRLCRRLLPRRRVELFLAPRARPLLLQVTFEAVALIDGEVVQLRVVA